ncbi:hypothetical protein CONPUDRAFT_167798 [Coniophora puteana RWD-64-598 SS2]|uniref:DUF6533 domain-containing protein n=1 Tax=Coniophora puteana (strain RWD-64-598) TaxID=741705 RepID=A0A5M3MFF7_CONPW|nr:uncharacterized protein CONPUDRAFT_167798 [Coniophora puteana RWD-64-598 SS2]EIW77726.1 hypothetical protein CONPUDRAFT_167798 [Coniophora puteana RWD-64-598 SS2]
MAETLHDVETLLLHLRACQYVAASGFIILLYDHFLTFGEEVRLIWQAKFTLAKVLFLYTRYIVPMAMFVQTFSFSGIGGIVFSDEVCKQWGISAFAFGVSSIAISDFMVLLRLWVIWDRRLKLVVWTLFLFILAEVITVIVFGFLTGHITASTSYNLSLHVCQVSTELHLSKLWAPGVASQIMVFVTALWNAYDKPRAHNVNLGEVLCRDGTLYFAALVSLRVVNLVLATSTPVSLQFLGLFFVWCATTVTVSRLVLNLRAVSADYNNSECDDDESEELTSLPSLHLHDSLRHSITADMLTTDSITAVVAHDFNPHKSLPTPRGTLRGYPRTPSGFSVSGPILDDVKSSYRL